MYEHLKDRMGVFRSEPYFLELVPKGIDKAQSLAVLLKEIGMTKEEMITVGDGFNDLSMIQYAGLFLFFPFYHKLTINHQFFDIFSFPPL